MLGHKRITPEQVALGSVTMEDITRAVLWSIEEMANDHCVFPSPEARDAAVLWVAHAWVIEAFDVTPRLSLRSMEPGSGKSVVMEVLAAMAPNVVGGVNMTPAVVWRIMPTRPVLTIDEVDTIFGKNGSGSAHVTLRGILNAGYRRGAYVLRTSGAEGIVRFPIFGAVMMAGLGRVPETLASRSVEIELRRRKAGDPVIKPFRIGRQGPAIKVITDRCEAWAKKATDELRFSVPSDVPGSNRDAEIWEPLIAVADLAGEEWGRRARAACKALTAVSAGKPTSLGVQLLTDTRTVMGGRERMPSADLVRALIDLPSSVWTIDNMDEGKMSRLLSTYGIRPKAFKSGGATRRGYLLSMFEDTWERYVPTREAALTEA